MRQLVACGATLLLVIAVAFAQKDKDGGKKPPKVEEPKAIVALRALGAVIETDDKKAYVGVNLFGAKIGDADLANVAGIKTLRTLDLSGTPIGDAGLAHAKGLTGLETLDLRHTRVSDAGLANLAGLKNLTYLNLSGTGVSA